MTATVAMLVATTVAGAVPGASPRALAQDTTPTAPMPSPTAPTAPMPSATASGAPSPTAPTPSATASGAPSATESGAPAAPEPADEPADQPDGGVADGLTLAPQPPAGWPTVPVSTARAVMAVDATTGQVLATVNVDERVQVASTVKLLTVVTALDVLSPDQEVTVGQEVAAVGGSTAALDPGDTWTVRDLVAGALVRSGNDAAEALAVAGGDGDRDVFLALMNDKAASLGITGATIADPSGLEDANLLSARDLVAIGRAALATPLVAEIAASRTWDLPSTGVVPNRNLLLEQREDATGLKTGTTDLAGASLVGSVRNGTGPDAHDLLVAVLGTRNDEQRYLETNAVFDWIEAELAREPVEVGARIRLPGEWIGEVVTLDVWSPAVPEVDTTLAVDGSSVVSELSLPSGGQLGEYVATADRPPPSSIGESVVGTLYDGMRQAHELGMWDR